MPSLFRDSLITYFVFILPLFCLALYAAYEQYFYAADTSMATKPSNHNLNVFKKPLALFSRQPLTGFYRDGYCRTGPSDTGNHAIAGILTQEFLDFSAARGNNLQAVPGIKPGCKWCLCTARWKEAVDALAGGEVKDEKVVPRVALHATHESALEVEGKKGGVSMELLKKYAAEGEAQMGGGALERNVPIDAKGGPGGITRETH